MAPQVTESVVAVDPVSERALLGTAGDFLALLEKALPADARNAGAIGRHFESLFTNGIGMDELKEGPDFLGVKLKYWAPLMTQYQQAKRDGQLTADSQAIPLIVRSGTALDLKYSVKIEEIDGSGNVTKDVGTVTRSLDKDYLPFVSKSLFALAWPGSKDLSQLMGETASFSQGLYNPATWTTDFAAAPTYKDGDTAANGAADKSATPGEWVTVNRLPDKAAGAAVDQTQRDPVDERSYRENLETGKKLATLLAMVYGTFDAAQVSDAAGDINRLPLGGYDPAPFTLTKDATGTDVQHRTQAIAERHGPGQPVRRRHHRLLRPRGRPRLRGERLRDRRHPGPRQGSRQLEAGAARGGEARQRDPRHGPAGHRRGRFGPRGHQHRRSRLLQGRRRQGIATGHRAAVLGPPDAADAVTGSLSATNLTLLFLTLCGAALLTGASTVSYVRKRRSEAGTLRAMGWTQRRSVLVLAEFGVGAALLAIVGIAPSLLSWSTATAVVSASVLVLYVGAAFFAAQQLRHREVVDQEPQQDERFQVDSPLTFANRQLEHQQVRPRLLAVAVGVFGGAVGGLVALLIDIPRAAGASALSGFAAASITLPSIILAVSGVAVGLVLTMVTGRFELQAKRQYLGTLRAMGWNPDMLGQVRLFENAMVGTVALPLGVVGARHRPPPRPLCRTVGRYCRSVAVLCWIPIATKVVQ